MPMTRGELAKLDDRALDALVAERVMDRSPEIVWIATTDGGQSAMVSSDRECFGMGKRYVEKWIAEHPVVAGERLELASWTRYPHYSTNPSSAWEVVEKFTDAYIEKAGEGYEVRISGWATARAPTMPRAVCIAALLAVGEKGEAAK